MTLLFHKMNPNPFSFLISKKARRCSVATEEHSHVEPLSTHSTFISGPRGIQQLLKNNKAWAEGIQKKNPEFFPSLAKAQHPEILWIGCSDSRVPANQIMLLQPGEVFVHCNVANQVVHSDLNCLSVLEYAVNILKVKHIIVCGHYGCGGIHSALSRKDYGLVNNWLLHIKDIYKEHRAQLEGLPSEEQCERLTELNVARQVHNLCYTSIVQNAWAQGQELSIHGWCYKLSDGIINDLKLCKTGQNQMKPEYILINCSDKTKH